MGKTKEAWAKEIREELKRAYGTDAEFREGQEEAILNVLAGKRELVVQKTGWGKSLVYFMAIKMLRKESDGIALIISPLLALMNNQIFSGEAGLAVGEYQQREGVRGKMG